MKPGSLGVRELNQKLQAFVLNPVKRSNRTVGKLRLAVSLGDKVIQTENFMTRTSQWRPSPDCEEIDAVEQEVNGVNSTTAESSIILANW